MFLLYILFAKGEVFCLNEKTRLNSTFGVEARNLVNYHRQVRIPIISESREENSGSAYNLESELQTCSAGMFDPVAVVN